jgi:CRISPR-associated endonuclease Csn1
MRNYANKEQKLIYRLWQEQEQCCAYSGQSIGITELWTASVEVDHIVPKSLCLDDSYINKVVCLTLENRAKGQKTPIEAWGNDEEKWDQITQRIERFYPDRPWKKYRKNATHPKKKQFSMRQEDISKKYGMASSQLNDTRYISKLAMEYLKQLGCDVSVTKGSIVAEVRSQWGLNSVIGQTNKKERTDHRHHTVDAIVIAHINRGLHNRMTQAIQHSETTGEKFRLPQPSENFRTGVKEKLKHLIVSHTPHRKLSGALHEETGAGYIKKHSALVYRKALSPELKIDKILDKTVKNIIEQHLEDFGGNIKAAFADGVTIYHKDGKTPIKRVRVLQSKIKTTKKQTAEDILQQTKFGVKDKSGKIFKYMSYGNNHHVEIIQNTKTGKIKAEFVTMMQASHRAKGINIPKQPIVKTNHGGEWEFLMALHINDTVSIKKDKDERVFYRVQKLDANNKKFVLRLNTASTLSNKDEELNIGISKENFYKYKIKLHKINAIGGLIDD